MIRAGVAAPGAALGGILDRLSPGRKRRRLWVSGGKAHIEVRGSHQPGRGAMARDLEEALQALEGVQWAQVNAVSARVVVAFEPDSSSVDDIVDVIEGVEEVHQVSQERFPHERPEHPGDVEPVRRQAIAIGADVAALGGSVMAPLFWATPIPAEIGSLVSLVENAPRVRHFLEQHIGMALTDLGIGVTSAFVQAFSQGPLTLLTDITHRTNQLGELQANRRTWERREADLYVGPLEEPLEAVEVPPRPQLLGSGLIETYADVAAAASVAGAAAVMVVTRSPRRAAGIITAAVPKAARHGREAFAATLGRELAARDVVVLDREALRRLDRIDTVVLDTAVLGTGRLVIGTVQPIDDEDVGTLTAKALALFDPSRPARLVRRGAWALGPLRQLGVEAPRGGATRARTRGGSVELGVVQNGELRGTVTLELELDSLAEPLAELVRNQGYRLVVAGKGGGLGPRLGADEVVDGGTRLAGSVRTLQEHGRGVLLVSGGANHAALRAADVGVGVEGHGAHPPWGAALLTSPGLTSACLVVASLSAARSVARRSVAISAAGSVTGAAWSLVGPGVSASRRAAIPVNVAALAAQAVGTVAASSLGRRPPPLSAADVPWHSMAPEAVLRALGTSRRGLSPAEAARRHGALRAEGPQRVTFPRAVASELANPLTPIMLV